jgi:lipopolysaccharide biosynthesis glycosyltransferase
MMNIVTCSDKNYIPGVIALYNSLQKSNGSKFKFYLLADGNPKDFEVFDETGVNIIYNQSLDKNPKGGEWKEELPCMYSRVLIPEIFGDVYKKSLYLDADTLVIDDISALEEMKTEHCLLGMPNKANCGIQKARNDYQFERWDRPDKGLLNHWSLNSGVILFDNEKWNRDRMTSKFVEAIGDDRISAKFVVQGYLSIILEGKFDYLTPDWNTSLSSDINFLNKGNKIVHYIGGRRVKKPWEHGETNLGYINYWKQNYLDGKIL